MYKLIYKYILIYTLKYYSLFIFFYSSSCASKHIIIHWKSAAKRAQFICKIVQLWVGCVRTRKWRTQRAQHEAFRQPAW